MILEGKVLVTVDRGGWRTFVPASGENSEVPQFLVIAQAVVETIDADADLSILKVYAVLPTENAEQMLLGMMDGETNIVINGMSPVIEPESGCTSRSTTVLP